MKLRWRFSLLGLLALVGLIAVVLGVCSNLWRVPRVRKQINVAIRADGVYLDDRRVSDEQFDHELIEFLAQWEQWHERYGTRHPPVHEVVEFATIRLTAASDIRYAQLCRLMRRCSALGLGCFETEHAGRVCVFTAGFRWPHIIGPCGDDLTSTLHIYADEQGMCVESGPVRSWGSSIQRELTAALFGGDPEHTRFAVDGEDELTWEHLRELIAEITKWQRSDGTPVFRHLHFVDEVERPIRL